MGIKLIGKLPDWVSAKDVVLEMLRRYDVTGGRGYILEYYGPGLKTLSAWDRHVIIYGYRARCNNLCLSIR
jgi:aconitate hydratase